MTTSRRFIALFFVLSLFLCSCGLEAGDALLRLPNPPKSFEGLQKQVDVLINSGGEYAPPVSGNNRQVFQTYDLTSDGKEEALVFMRFPGENSLRIYIYQLDDENYEEMSVISEAAEKIELIRYHDLDGDGALELIVGWQMGNVLKTLSVYKFTENSFDKILSTNYTYVNALDMRGSGHSDLLVLHHDPVNFTGSAELFYVENNEMLSAPPVKLSQGTQSIVRIQSGLLSDGYMALYVACKLENAFVTDVLTYRDGHFFNVSLNPASEVSDETIRNRRLYAAELNGDGIICLPKISPLPGYEDVPDNQEFWLTEWRNYDSRGRVSHIMTTYYNLTDGWYIVLPDSWIGHFTVTSRETSGSVRSTTLAYVSDGITPIDLCVIYTISGDNRVSASTQDDRFPLKERTDIAYAAKLLPTAHGVAPVRLDEDILTQIFRLIESSWITGEVTGI